MKETKSIKVRDIRVGNIYGYINDSNEIELFTAQDIVLCNDAWIIASENGIELKLQDIIQVELTDGVLKAFEFVKERSYLRRFKGVGKIEVRLYDKLKNFYFVDLYYDLFNDSIVSPFYVKYINELQDRVYDLTGVILEFKEEK
jgi:hypothetical protein